MEVMEKTSNSESFLSDSFSLAADLLSHIYQTLNSLKAFAEFSEDQRNNLITYLTLDISKFVEVTALSSRFLAPAHKDFLTQVKESHIQLLFIMKAINQAQLKQDIVALEDLIKYELKDNLTQWKIDLIPQSKRLLIS
jgi:hypothetical protein